MPRISAKPNPTGRSTLPSAIPKPEGIFDPVARALEAIGDRWTLVLLGQLLSGPRGFQELRQRTGIAPRVLSSRLRELVESGFVRTVSQGSRSVYTLTEEGSGLEPVIQSIGRWWIERGKEVLGVDTERFTETSAQSVLEALPFMLDRERSHDADISFEIRLEGPGGGVWTVKVSPTFAKASRSSTSVGSFPPAISMVADSC